MPHPVLIWGEPFRATRRRSERRAPRHDAQHHLRCLLVCVADCAEKSVCSWSRTTEGQATPEHIFGPLSKRASSTHNHEREAASLPAPTLRARDLGPRAERSNGNSPECRWSSDTPNCRIGGSNKIAHRPPHAPSRRRVGRGPSGKRVGVVPFMQKMFGELILPARKEKRVTETESWS